MKKIVVWLLIASIGILSFGCLSFESKEYTWTINKDGSGTGKIVWRNLFSTGNEEENTSADDFVSLINDYLEGESVDDVRPGFKKVAKRLFIEDGVLCGELTFEFGKFEDAGFYRYKGQGPYMYNFATSDETFYKSNGDWSGDNFSVLFWSDKTTQMTLVTSYGDPNQAGALDLIAYYNEWKDSGVLPETGE
jgi:hypothetical protein